MYVSLIPFQTLVNFNFKINRVRAYASYVENKESSNFCCGVKLFDQGIGWGHICGAALKR